MDQNENSDSIVEFFLRQVNANPDAVSDIDKELLKDALKDYSREDVEDFFRLGLSDTIEALQFLVIDLVGDAAKLGLKRPETERARERSKKTEEKMQRKIMRIKEILSQPRDKSVQSIIDSSVSSFMLSYGKVLLPEERIHGLMKKIGLGVSIVGLIAGIGLAVAGVLLSSVLLYCGFGLLIVGLGVFVAVSRKKMLHKEKSKFADSTLGESLKKTGIFNQSQLNSFISNK